MISFTVEGVPAPKGSMRAFKTRRGKVAVTHDNERTRPWGQLVAWSARRAMERRMPVSGPVAVCVAFYLPRPKSVKRPWPCVKPDVDKLQRALLDAMTSIVWVDDGQVVSVRAVKHYADGGNRPRAVVSVDELEDIEP